MSSARHKSHPQQRQYFLYLVRSLKSSEDSETKPAKWIENFNSTLRVFGKEYLIPTGSSVDWTKIATATDFGDIDVLLVTKRVTIPEQNLVYVKGLPTLVQIDGRDLKEKYRIPLLVEGKYIPSRFLKDIKEDVFSIVRGLMKCVSMPCASSKSGTVQYTVESGVGLEKRTLHGVDYDCLGLSTNKLKDDEVIDTLEEVMVPNFQTMVSNVGECICESEEEGKSQKLKPNINLLHTMFDIMKATVRAKKEEKVDVFVSSVAEFVESLDNEGHSSDDDVPKKDQITKGMDMCSEERPTRKRKPGKEKTRCDREYGTEHKKAKFSQINSSNSCTKDNKRSPGPRAKDKVNSTDFTSNDMNVVASMSKCSICDTNAEQDDEDCPLTFHNDLNEIEQVLNQRKEESVSGSESDTSPRSSRQVYFDKFESMDIVPGFEGSGWPKPALEWIYRERLWPSKYFIEELVKAGYHVIAKMTSYDCSEGQIDESTTFRLSFSQQEIKLVQSMSEPQKMCLRVLKAFQKSYLATESELLRSYCWKTACLWMSEQKESSFWKEETLLDAVVEVIEFMLTKLEEKFLPHYFVRDMNLIHDCKEKDRVWIISKLKKIISNPTFYLEKFVISPPKAGATCEISPESLKDLEEESHNGIHKGPFKVFAEEFSKGFGKEFHDLNNGQTSPNDFARGIGEFFNTVTSHMASKTRSRNQHPVQRGLMSMMNGFANTVLSKAGSQSSSDCKSSDGGKSNKNEGLTPCVHEEMDIELD